MEQRVFLFINKNKLVIILPHTPLLQLADWLDDPEQDPRPLQDLSLVLVPQPQLLLHDPYGPQEPHDAVKKGHTLLLKHRLFNTKPF